jgi:hypothetical protein
MLTPESLDGLREGLIALTAIRERREDALRGSGGSDVRAAD